MLHHCYCVYCVIYSSLGIIVDEIDMVYKFVDGNAGDQGFKTGFYFISKFVLVWNASDLASWVNVDAWGKDTG